MKDTTAWSFLVGCNQSLDYRTVVAPNFMCEAGIAGLLARVTEGDLTEEGTAFYREIHNSQVGDITLIFRVIEAIAEDTGISGNGVLKDLFGREIYLIEGIALKGIVPSIVTNVNNLEEAHKQVLGDYRKFWEAEDSVSAVASDSFTLQSQGEETGLKYIKLKPYVAGNKVAATKWQRLYPEPQRFEGAIHSIAIFPDGKNIAIRYGDRKIVVWSVQDKQELYYLSNLRGLTGGYPTPIAIDPTGHFLTTAMIESLDQNKVKVWHLDTKEPKDIGNLGIGPTHRVTSVAFTPDSKTVIIGSADGRIKLLDSRAEGLEIGTLSSHAGEVKCLAVDLNNWLLASGDGKGEIKLWNLHTQKQVILIQGHSLPVNSLAFSPGCQTLLSGSDDHTIKFWNVKTGDNSNVVELDYDITSVVFSSDGNLFATGDYGGNIQIWDFQSKKDIFKERVHSAAVTSVVFSPDGRTLISGSKDSTIAVLTMIVAI
ncbi:WD40 repeat domain-containing protein [Microcoleus sp. herbarium7]|uniref:WD40 repeat domain-containing protein n=1 Tax=Microcoleus sp. herbarium7 TaxID=3055435 RepID=UPI002FD71EEB